MNHDREQSAADDGTVDDPFAQIYDDSESSDENTEQSDESAAAERVRQKLEYERQQSEQQLDEKRIRVVLMERRSENRKRVWAQVGTVCLMGLGGQMFYKAFQARTGGDTVRVGSFAILGIGCVIGAVWLLLRSRAKQRVEPVQDGPSVTPDFSTLSDGSQIAAGLSAMTEQPNKRQE